MATKAAVRRSIAAVRAAAVAGKALPPNEVMPVALTTSQLETLRGLRVSCRDVLASFEVIPLPQWWEGEGGLI